MVALAAPRPDFDGALQEFLIGLLTAALLPANEEEWLTHWMTPPSPSELLKAFDALPPAFNLDGDGPRFFQDFSTQDFADIKPTPIEQILLNAPGDQTVRLNTDLFVKRGRVSRMGRPAAAMALLTMQTYAPSGGQGHRTSLRGGGPLTTLVDPRLDNYTLWHMLWANVETRIQWNARRPDNATDDVFPWLHPTRVSDPATGGATSPSDGHPLQVYFGLPRRIRLEFGDTGECDLTGRPDDRTVVAFRMRNYGVQYDGWQHPLSPYRASARTPNLWLPVHGQPGGINWRDWLGLTFRVPATHRRPAATVEWFQSQRARALSGGAGRVHAFGYDMDNMKARAWVESAFPVFTTPGAEHQGRLVENIQYLVNGTELAASALLTNIKRALFQRADVPGDLSQAKTDLWIATEGDFLETVRQIASSSAAIDSDYLIRERFIRTLARKAAEIFDRWCSMESLPIDTVRRLVTARFYLVATLNGHSKLGEKMFTMLGMPLDDRQRAPRPRKQGKEPEAAA